MSDSTSYHGSIEIRLIENRYCKGRTLASRKVKSYEMVICDATKSPFPGIPKLKIPLRPTDADVVLELQPLLEAAYTNGGYADDIDYNKSPLLPLPKIVADWVRQ